MSKKDDKKDLILRVLHMLIIATALFSALVASLWLIRWVVSMTNEESISRLVNGAYDITKSLVFLLLIGVSFLLTVLKILHLFIVSIADLWKQLTKKPSDKHDLGKILERLTEIEKRQHDLQEKIENLDATVKSLNNKANKLELSKRKGNHNHN